MLQPASPTARRERILSMGPFGSGKTTAWLNIALWAHTTGSPMKFYAIDTDNALEAFLEPNAKYGHLDWRQPGGNVEWVTAWEWPDYEAAVANFGGKVTHEDMTIVDFISPSWEAVQNYYIEEIFKQDSADYFLETRKNMKGGNPLDGWKDWQYINKLYKRWIGQVLNNPGHKFFTAQATALMETDDKGLRATFGSYGVKPKGQKELGYQTHTVLLTSVDRKGDTTVTTIKDRERERLMDHSINEFTIDYLVNVAGWQL